MTQNCHQGQDTLRGCINIKALKLSLMVYLNLPLKGEVLEKGVSSCQKLLLLHQKILLRKLNFL